MRNWLWIGLAALLTLTACGTRGQARAAMERDTLYYGDSAARAQQAQILLNIVKLRYGDPVGFVEIDTLTTEDSVTVSGGLETALGLDDGPFSEVLGAAGGFERSSTPSVVYSNLYGSRYARQLLEPLPSSSIFLLSQSGWSVERLLLCCVARIGKVENARAAAGPTPSSLPRNDEFRALARALRSLQVEQNLIVQVVRDSDDSTDSRVILKWKGDGPAASTASSALRNAGFGQIEGLPGSNFMIRIADRAAPEDDRTIQGRSLLGIMSALSQTVRLPESHRGFVQATDGQVATASADPCAPAEPWGAVTGDIFAVQSSANRPDTASVAVRYREHWFYVDDRCISAKATLNLLSHLYALQAAISDGDNSSRRLLLIGN